MHYTMEDMKRVQIPAFGNWDYCDEMPITQYFESAMQAGLIRGHFYTEEEEDTTSGDISFKVAKPVLHHHTKVRKSGGGGGGERKMPREQQLRKQRKVHDLTNQSNSSPRKLPKAPKAVDEDLYKIPPELLHQKPKKKRLLRNLWSGCLSLNCIA